MGMTKFNGPAVNFRAGEAGGASGLPKRKKSQFDTGGETGGFDPGSRSGGPMNGMYPAQVANQTGQNQPNDGGIRAVGPEAMATDYASPSGIPRGPQPAADNPMADSGNTGPATGGYDPRMAGGVPGGVGGGSIGPMRGEDGSGGVPLGGGGFGRGGFKGRQQPTNQGGPTAVATNSNTANSTGNPNDINELSNSFLGGKLFDVNTTPRDIRGTRQGLADYFGKMGPGAMNAATADAPGRVNIGGGERVAGNYGSYIPELDRNQIRDVNAPNSLSTSNAPTAAFGGFQGDTPTTQSLDQLGPGSTFSNNIVNQLNPIFAQRREQALAQAKESAGNLTGSSFANILGKQVNKSLGEENAQILDYSTRAAQSEQARQAADADRGQNRIIRAGELGTEASIANLNPATQFGLKGADLGLEAGKANQGADVNFLNSLNQRGQLGQGAESLGLQRDLANQENTRSYNQNQGSLDQARNLAMYGAGNEMNNANANRFADSLGRFTSTGVGPNEIVSSGGAGVLAGPLGEFFGGRGGGGSRFTSGGGADDKGNFGVAGDVGGALKRGVGGLFGRGGGGGGGTVGGNIIGEGLGTIGKKLGGAGAAYGAGELAAGALGRNTMGGKIASAAGKGAAIGSVVPGVGTAIGGAIGGAIPVAKKAGKWLKKRLSDEELKTDIVPIGNGLFDYRWKGTDHREIGFIAQDVQRVLPSAVSRGKDGYLRVDYSKTAKIINAMNGVH